MTDSQLYVAIGLPTLAVLFGILTNVKLDVKFDTLTATVIDVDNRVTRIEAKLGHRLDHPLVTTPAPIAC